jgi:hypothetical protein
MADGNIAVVVLPEEPPPSTDPNPEDVRQLASWIKQLHSVMTDETPLTNEFVQLTIRFALMIRVCCEDDARQECKPEYRIHWRNYTGDNPCVWRFARLMGYEFPRDALIGAYELGDVQMMCMVSEAEKLPWDKEFIDMMASDGKYGCAQYALESSKRSGLAFEWDDMTCWIVRNGTDPKHEDMHKWMHSLPIEQQPCKGACNACAE